MLILYVGLFNLYIYDLTRIEISISKMFYSGLTGLTLLFFIADLKAGFVNGYHKQFNLLLFLCVIINNGIIFCTHGGLPKPKIMFYAFNLSVFAITLTIFVCGWKYKTFRD